MKERVAYILRFTIFWLALFILSRILFLFYQGDLSFQVTFGDWLRVLLYGLKMDISAVAYLLSLPLLLIIIDLYLHGRWFKSIMLIYGGLLVLVSTGIVMVDLQLYRNWGFRMDDTILLYISTPKDMMASAPTQWIILALLGWLLLSFLLFLVYRKLVDYPFRIIPSNRWKAALVFGLLFFALIIPIRGGFGIAPLNNGSTYFHSDPFPNHATTNVVWNVGYSLAHLQPASNPYRFIDPELAERRVHEMYASSDSTTRMVGPARPNVIIMILESMTAKIIAPLGGNPEVAPSMNALAEEGILFSRIYCSGDRTDKALPAILCGYPAQPTASVIKYPQKSRTLSYLPKEFKNRGYHTGFYYGGNIDFANMRSFVIQSGFDEFITKDDFDPQDYNSKWGVHDGILLDSLQEILQGTKEPFFSVVLTLSSHEPFDVPMEPIFPGGNEETRFLNSAHYADKCIGNFIREAREKSWWDNTIIITVADHGTRHPGKSPYWAIERFHIPMVWTGGAISEGGITIDRVGSITDLATTLMKQLGWSSPFKFSNDLLDPNSQSFAIYAFNDGFGYLTDSTSVIYDNLAGGPIEGDIEDNSEELYSGKILQQHFFQDYLDAGQRTKVRREP